MRKNLNALLLVGALSVGLLAGGAGAQTVITPASATSASSINGARVITKTIDSSDFLTEVVKLGHAEGMKVNLFKCVTLNQEGGL